MFEDNVVAGGCYGVDLYTTTGSIANRFVNNKFIHNRTLPLAEGETALSPGGAIVVYGGCTNTQIRNCLIVANTNGQSAAQITIEKPSSKTPNFKVDNCTIADNAAVDADNGYGIYMYYKWNEGYNALSIRNCIITRNACATNALLPSLDVPNVYDSISKGYNLFTNCIVGTPGYKFPDGQHGCRVGVDPKFVGFGKTPHALRRMSPACGLGSVFDWMTADTIDLAGRPRVRDGLVDAGCYSYYPMSGLVIIFK